MDQTVAVRALAAADDSSVGVRDGAAVTVSGAESIEIAATPGRELSILTSTLTDRAGGNPLAVTCAWGRFRSEACSERSLTGVTQAPDRLVVSVPAATSGAMESPAEIEVTIAHH